ncbi:hypothetical protein QF049_006234 [Paenibacillus sp. W4I10]|nr:hypothetical protein [Paenibacillus sp. W4I10]
MEKEIQELEVELNFYNSTRDFGHLDWNLSIYNPPTN